MVFGALYSMPGLTWVDVSIISTAYPVDLSPRAG
jgi:hypothetical protein